jgi:tetratricopeptide (TPR) repeat protein
MRLVLTFLLSVALMTSSARGGPLDGSPALIPQPCKVAQGVPRPPRPIPSVQLDMITRVLKRDTQNFILLTSRAMLYAEYGQIAEATADFEEAIRLAPDNSDVLRRLCLFQMTQGDTASALKVCDRAVKASPVETSFLALDTRGMLYLKLCRNAEALADYDKAMRPIPFASTLFGRGIAKMRTGDYDGGAADIAAAKAITPYVTRVFEQNGITEP